MAQPTGTDKDRNRRRESMNAEDLQDPAALIRVAYGSQGVAELAGGQPVPCRFRRSVGRPCCGDRVRLERDDATTFAVSEILPRRNEFVRADRQGRRQVLASNLDRVLVVIAPRPAPSQDLVERYLVAVHSLGIKPALVINKAELAAGAPPPEPPFSRLGEYRRLGYPVVHTSCKASPGIEALLPLLRDATSVLVGQSGVGKSSLVNRLIPDLELQTGELSRATGKGTHTTTTTILYTLPGGGRLIDSPGVWEYGLWDMSPGELAAGFPEFADPATHCRFNNCRHAGEPGCAVDAAVREGAVPAWRLASYRRLLEQS
jgi:ribosome biogenesis GTPase